MRQALKLHKTVWLFTHEPQACYSRVSVECQHWMPGQIQPQSLGEEGDRPPENRPVPLLPCDSELFSFFRHGAQINFHTTRSLDICHPCGIQTCHQNVTMALLSQADITHLFCYLCLFKIDNSSQLLTQLNKKCLGNVTWH